MNKGNIIMTPNYIKVENRPDCYQRLSMSKLRRLMDALGKNHAGMNKAMLVRTIKALTGTPQSFPSFPTPSLATLTGLFFVPVKPHYNTKGNG